MAAIAVAAWDAALESIDEVRTVDCPSTLDRSGDDATIVEDGADNPIVDPMDCGNDNGIGWDNPPAVWALYLMK